jgi:hypothetical protein
MREYGPTTELSTGRWVRWEQVESTLGQPFDVTKIPLSKLHQMRRDPMIAFGLLFCKVPLIRARWYIKSENAQISAFVDNALRSIYPRFIYGWTNCYDFGYSGLEKRFEQAKPDWVYFDGTGETEKPVWPENNIDALIWKPFSTLAPDSIEPHWNDDGEFDGIDYFSPTYGTVRRFPGEEENSGEADIPVEKALWVTNEKDSVFGSLWGFPRIAYAYRYWWSYWYRWALADRHFEKDADPSAIVYYPPEISEDRDGNEIDMQTVALNLGENARSGSTIALPSDTVMADDGRVMNLRKWEIKFLEGNSNFTAFDQTFEYLDIAKLRSVMVPEQSLLEGRGGTSSRNVAEQLGDILFEAQAISMGQIDNDLNRYVIPQLVEANFGPGHKVEKVTTGFSDQDVEMAKQIVQLFGQSDPTLLEVNTREILQQMGIPLLSPVEVEKRKKEIQKEAENSKPPEIKPRKGFAGVNQWGTYQADKPKVQMGEGTYPFTIQLVSDLIYQEQPRQAFYNKQTNSLLLDEKITRKYANSVMNTLVSNSELEFDEVKQAWNKIRKRVSA